MVTLHEAQIDYINRWNVNAYQHYLDGDYNWAASLVKKTGVNYIIEIGCGTGYSTLALANNNIHSLSIDSIPEALDKTKSLLKTESISVGYLDDESKSGVLLKQWDIFEDYNELLEFSKYVELIYICNPGGCLDLKLSQSEIDILKWGQYTDEVINQFDVFYLHKIALLLSAAKLSKDSNKKLMIIDRGEEKDLVEEFEFIELVSGLNIIRFANRYISPAPVQGIQIENSDKKDLIWKAALFESK